MAEKKFSPFPVLKQDKLPIYRSLCEVGQATKNITECLDELDDPAFPKGMLRLFRAQAETLEAGIAHLLTGVMHHRESVDWYHFGKQADDLAERQKKLKKTTKQK